MSFDALKGHPRLTPVRSDLAAMELKGLVYAPRYVEGRDLNVSVPLSGMSDEPSGKGEMINQVIFGEPFRVYDVAGEWAWGQSADGYVGYIRAKSLRTGAPEPTHRVITHMCQVRQEADPKARPVGGLPYGSRITVTEEWDDFVRMEGGGSVARRQLTPLAEHASDWVAETEIFHRAPYLWGGRSNAGIDCSGLIQVALQAAGRDCPRDSDMQEATLGEPVAEGEPLTRGDLVFWKGHVGVMTDAETLFHANAYHMAAVYEPLEGAKARIAASDGGDPTSIRRLG